jgi:hypothetical protein
MVCELQHRETKQRSFAFRLSADGKAAPKACDAVLVISA